MANVSEKGIFPISRKADEEYLFIVDSGNGTNIMVGDVVSAVAAGAVNQSAANDNTIVVGTVLELFDSNKVPVGHWNSSQTTKYLPASTAGYALVALALPGRRFRAQTNTILTVAAIMATTDHVATAGTTTTARSNHIINGADLNTGGQFLIIGPVNRPDNDITLANAKWEVVFNESLFAGSGKATGV